MRGIRFLGGVLYLAALVTAAVQFGWRGALLVIAGAAGCMLQNLKDEVQRDEEDRRSSGAD